MRSRSNAIVDVMLDIREEDAARRDLRRAYERSDLREHDDELAELPEFVADRVGVLAMLRPPQIGGNRSPFAPGSAPQPRTAVESRLRATRIESPKHLGRIDEGVVPIGFDDPRFELALGAFVQLASVIFDDQYGDGGAIRERRELLVRDRPSRTVAVNMRAISIHASRQRTSRTGIAWPNVAGPAHGDR